MYGGVTAVQFSSKGSFGRGTAVARVRGRHALFRRRGCRVRRGARRLWDNIFGDVDGGSGPGSTIF